MGYLAVLGLGRSKIFLDMLKFGHFLFYLKTENTIVILYYSIFIFSTKSNPIATFLVIRHCLDPSSLAMDQRLNHIRASAKGIKNLF